MISTFTQFDIGVASLAQIFLELKQGLTRNGPTKPTFTLPFSRVISISMPIFSQQPNNEREKKATDLHGEKDEVLSVELGQDCDEVGPE